MTDIGALNQEPASEATAINSAGQVIGQSGSFAFIYQNGSIANIGSLGGFETVARAINGPGEVVGLTQDMYSDQIPFVFKDGTVRSLRDLIGTSTALLTDATGINDAGQIVCTGFSDTFHFYLLTPANPPTPPAPSPTPTVMPPSAASIAGKKKLSTAGTKYTVKGKAEGDVTSVTYRVGSKGPYKKAIGTTSWRFTAKLKPGKNIITVIVHGPGGDSAPAKITVSMAL